MNPSNYGYERMGQPAGDEATALRATICDLKADRSRLEAACEEQEKRARAALCEQHDRIRFLVRERDQLKWDLAGANEESTRAEARLAEATARIAQGGEVKSIQEQVREDLVSREALGKQRYGTALFPHNGRCALQDAYEEALDLACYLKQALIEKGSP